MKKLLYGNEAIVRGAIDAGCQFFAGYPITPASEVLHIFIDSKKGHVLQMEDEIASINACIGASLAGAKAMTATSGPGFSLMQEGLGLAHMIGVPLVVVDAQRVGPSTGMPTMPAQGDVMQSRWGSHGDYFPIVFYPNSVSELYKFTIEAFNASEESLTPVILLSDGFLSHLYETVELINGKQKIIERKMLPLGNGTRHFTGLTNKDGIPKASDPDVHIEIVNRLRERQAITSDHYECYEYIEKKDSDTLIIAYGCVSRLAYYFKDRCSVFRPIRIFPVIDKLKALALPYERIIVIEMNAGQYVLEIERLLKRDVEFVPLLGGRLDIADIRRIL